MIRSATRGRLMASSMIAGLALGLAPAQGIAQTAATTTGTNAGSASVGEVVVTGSILRHQNVDSISPLQVVTSDDLAKRGLTTLDTTIQNLSGNNSGALPNSFTANGAFAGGASGASLRGLTTNSTLVLFDGLRAAYYPLADDGVRNFVDLNTIPDVIVDRVEVLQDGASSTYGADAIAGVINIITKKQYQGLTVTGEGGFGQNRGGAESHFSALLGHGDLGRDGYNVYLGIEYQHDGALYNRDRGFPYNTANLSPICGTSLLGGSTCMTNSVVNGLQFDNSFQGIGTTIVPAVRPYDAATNSMPGGNWQLLNPTAGCGRLTPITVTPEQAAAGGATGVDNALLCQQDLIHDYGVIAPQDDRFSASARLTKNLGGDAQAYGEVNYYQNDVSYINNPSSIRQQTTPGATGITFDTSTIALPVYVCASGVDCSAANGMLNPNNPFASLGEVARIRYRFGDIPAINETFSQVYRVAAGVIGTFGGDWHYTADATFGENDLTVTQKGDLFVQHLLDVVANGSYNFVDPSQNTQAVRDYISPTSTQNSFSRLAQVQANLSKGLLTLPGGPLQLGVGVAARYEQVFNPSANSDANGPTNRYFTINPFGAIGDRYVESADFEFDAPIVKQLDLDVSGRYDHYSTGQSNFSPKFAAKFKPFDFITFRGTYSRGFRIPSFAESNSLPTTGFVTSNAPPSFQALHNNDGYGVGYSLGLTTVGTAGLKPEKSQNITAGVVFQPIKQLSFSVDYYRIKKTDVIAPADFNLALTAYYAGTPIPAGFQVIPGLPDPNLPNLMPVAGFIKYGFANLNSLITDGFDFSATARVNLPRGIGWTSAAQATYVNRYDLTLPQPDGTTQTEHFAGTIGPYVTTSASGTPRWRANWQNTLDFGRETLSATVYYTSGYEETAEDFGGTRGDCVGSAAASGVPTTYQDGVTPVVCHVHHFIDVDLHASYKATDRVQVYLNVSNVFDTQAPFDPTTYGGYQYNPAWANAGIVGRFFKIGATATF